MQLAAPLRTKIAERWSITRITAYHWVTRGSIHNHRRLRAAVQANAYDIPHWVDAKLSDWLSDNGVTLSQLAEYYNYNADSLRRFYHDPTTHQRLIDMVSYFKEVQDDVAHFDNDATQ